MSAKPSQKSLIGVLINLLPIKIIWKKTEKKKILEIDPSKIKAGEAKIVEVSNWCGLVKECFGVLNVDGKKLVIEQVNKRNRR